MRISRKTWDKLVYFGVLPLGALLIFIPLYAFPGKLSFLGRMTESTGKVTEHLSNNGLSQFRLQYVVDSEGYSILSQGSAPDVGSIVPIMYYQNNPASAIYGSRMQYMSRDVLLLLLGMVLMGCVLGWKFVSQWLASQEYDLDHIARMKRVTYQGNDWRASPLRLLETRCGETTAAASNLQKPKYRAIGRPKNRPNLRREVTEPVAYAPSPEVSEVPEVNPQPVPVVQPIKRVAPPPVVRPAVEVVPTASTPYQNRMALASDFDIRLMPTGKITKVENEKLVEEVQQDDDSDDLPPHPCNVKRAA